MSIAQSTDKTTVPRVRRWESIDRWFDRWDKAHDPDSRYGRYGKDPATIIAKADAS